MRKGSKVITAIREHAAEAKLDALCTKVVELLKESFDTYDWVGIYHVCGQNLNLGAYLGAPTEHEIIAIGQGICGAAIQEDATVVVPDVSADARHLACSPETKSEIVVPVKSGDITFAEIDIYSNNPTAFGDDDRKMLEEIAAILGARFWSEP
jgi:L-methionine (R)-S-oxide reductase